jgi:hypothetical protein
MKKNHRLTKRKNNTKSSYKKRILNDRTKRTKKTKRTYKKRVFNKIKKTFFGLFGGATGQSSIIYNNISYIGDINSQGIPNGQGDGTFSDGTNYVGSWVNGKITGKGKMIFPNGTIYEGDFLNGHPNGQGKIIYPSGNSYDGEWVDGKRNGEGTQTLANGDIYIGKHVNNKREGWGKFIEKDENGNVVNTFEGSWLNDNPDKTSIANPELMT